MSVGNLEHGKSLCDISIIVPVFNTKSYLEKCIDSLIVQSCQSFEIVLIDDGSTDGSGAICDEYALHHSNVRVFHKENGGQSAARNLGIELAYGRYSTFVDSDDIVPPWYIEELASGIRQNEADMAIVQLAQICSQDRPTFSAESNAALHFMRVNTTQALSMLLSRQGISESPCGKLAKTSFWAKHRFPEDRVYEDLAVSVEIIAALRVFAVSQAKIYGQVFRPESTSRKKEITNKQFKDWNNAINDSLNAVLCADKSKVLEKQTECFLCLNYIRLIRQFRDIASPDSSSREILIEAERYLRDHKKEVFRNKYASRDLKAKAILIMRCPVLYDILFHVWQKLKHLVK